MRASELRIGNWVNEYGVPIQITPQHILGLHQIEVAGKICIDLEPIPPTEDWLIRLGFEKTDDWFIRHGVLLGYITTDDNYEYEYSRKQQPAQIKHVHQLQNIYHALTGEELTLTDQG